MEFLEAVMSLYNTHFKVHSSVSNAGVVFSQRFLVWDNTYIVNHSMQLWHIHIICVCITYCLYSETVCVSQYMHTHSSGSTLITVYVRVYLSEKVDQ